MNISKELETAIRKYLEIVDHGTEEQQGEERTILHEEMMNLMEKERIPFETRFDARFIARWLINQGKELNEPSPVMMYGKQNKYNGGISELYFTPPDDNKQSFIPVMVVIMPFQYQPFVTERGA